MTWWRPTSLGDRITLLVLLTSAVAIGLVTAPLAASNHARFKEVAFESLRVQASIAAINSVAPMGFGDVGTAGQVLSGIGALADVRVASLYTPEGRASRDVKIAAEREGGALYRIPVGRGATPEAVKAGVAQLAKDTQLPETFVADWLKDKGLGLYDPEGKALESSPTGYATVPTEMVGRMREDYRKHIAKVLTRRAVLAAAREITTDRRAAVLILTAFSQRDLIEQARDAGALAYLVKPFQRSELIPAVGVALGRFREMQALFDQNSSLEDQLETRKQVDRAKGILMDNHGYSESEAFSWIQKRAMQDRKTMRTVAGEIIAGDLSPDA